MVVFLELWLFKALSLADLHWGKVAWRLLGWGLYVLGFILHLREEQLWVFGQSWIASGAHRKLMLHPHLFFKFSKWEKEQVWISGKGECSLPVCCLGWQTPICPFSFFSLAEKLVGVEQKEDSDRLECWMLLLNGHQTCNCCIKKKKQFPFGAVFTILLHCSVCPPDLYCTML